MVSYIDIGTEMEVPGSNRRVMRVIILIDTVSFVVVGEHISCDVLHIVRGQLRFLSQDTVFLNVLVVQYPVYLL